MYLTVIHKKKYYYIKGNLREFYFIKDLQNIQITARCALFGFGRGNLWLSKNFSFPKNLSSVEMKMCDYFMKNSQSWLLFYLFVPRDVK